MARPVFTVSPISGEAPLTVTAHIHDNDGDSLLGNIQWDWGDGTPHGSGNDATHVYTVPGNYTLICTSDGEGDFSQTVNIIAFQPAPVAVDDSFEVMVNTPFSGSVADNDAAGPNLRAVIWTINTPPMHGTLDPWPGNGTFTYTPATDYEGSDSFTYDITNVLTSDSSTATVSLSVLGGTPSIRAWYKGKQVLLGLAANSLVFDGEQFVAPEKAKYIQIVETRTATGMVPPLWPESQSLQQVSLTWTNKWLCQVIALHQTPISDSDVVTINDPNNGVCVCGVTCLGTEIQYVEVMPTVIVVREPNPWPGFAPAPTPPAPSPAPSPAIAGIINLPTDLPGPESGDVEIPLENGLVLHAQPMRSVGGEDLGLLVTGITPKP